MRGSKTTRDDPEAGKSASAFALNSIAARYADLRIAVAGCCDRLLAASVDAAARARVSRLAGALILASFVIAAALAVALPTMAGAGGVLAAICSTLAVFWLAALGAASGRHLPMIGGSSLAIAAALLSATVALGGGLSSPLALLFAGLIFEPVWVQRTRGALLAGSAALLCSIAGQAAVSNLVDWTASAASAWFWLPSLSYLATMFARLAPSARRPAAETPPLNFLDMTASLGLTLGPGGDVQKVEGDVRAVLGVPAELLSGNGFFDRILVQDRVAYMLALGQARDGTPTRIEMLVRLAGDADSAPQYGLFEAILSPAGSQVVAIVRRQASAEALRAELLVANEHREAMTEARNKLLASVSHELRTPLNAIIGFSDMLLLELVGGFSDARQKEYVSLVRESGAHLLDVVNSILDVSKIEAGAYSINPQPFMISDAVNMCRSMMEGHAQAKAIELRTDLEPGLAEMTADRMAVQQMLINLVSNAIKFTPDGGTVTVSARRIGPTLAMTVRDTGIGIDGKDLERLGEPFTQVGSEQARRREGTGLGLSLVKGLVSLHGGQMEICSAPGEGTSVTITLPMKGIKGPSVGSGNLIKFGRKAKGMDSDASFRKTA